VWSESRRGPLDVEEEDVALRRCILSRLDDWWEGCR